MAGVMKIAKYIISALLLIIIINIFLVNPVYEGLDSPPSKEDILFKLTDTTSTLTDPNPIGTFYVYTDTSSSIKNTINMQSDASNINLVFDSANNTNMIIRPTQMPVTNIHKSNMFPKSFTIEYSFVNASKKYSLLNQDLSNNTAVNSIISYVAPGGDASGNFMNITFAKPFGESIKNIAGDQVGNVSSVKQNGIKISFSDSTGIDGLMLTYAPPA
jgi:hypothetical protein